jgi:hypothetical protein
MTGQAVRSDATNAIFSGRQGCQIILSKTRKIYQISIKSTKWPQNKPNGRKIYRPNGHKIYQQRPLDTYKTLENLPKLVFLLLKYTIWQTWWPLT